MTRKDYALIASIIYAWGLDDKVIRAFAYTLREDNRHFNIDKFLAACRGGAMRPTHTTHAK